MEEEMKGGKTVGEEEMKGGQTVGESCKDHGHHD
jgi:hypothetical protein